MFVSLSVYVDICVELYDSSFASRYMDWFKKVLSCPLNRHFMHLSFHPILPLLVYLQVHIDSILNFAAYLCIIRFVYKGIPIKKEKEDRITSSEVPCATQWS